MAEHSRGDPGRCPGVSLVSVAPCDVQVEAAARESVFDVLDSPRRLITRGGPPTRSTKVIAARRRAFLGRHPCRKARTIG